MAPTPAEKAALAQNVTNQPDGPGKRIGKRGEVHVIGNVLPGGGKLFRERIAQFQAEAGYWETHVGTVHDFRVLMFDNDTRILISAIYDGDFLPYLADVINQAGPWFDMLMPGVWEGYTSASDTATRKLIGRQAYTADAFYAGYPDLTTKDIAKMRKLRDAVNAMLDSAS
ncbi:MAG: hypothetical protein FJ271_32670 [Planctomycetes bacterium]|nr:hypothetical protein [Planctomycetota bacterium]